MVLSKSYWKLKPERCRFDDRATERRYKVTSTYSR